MQRQLNLKCPWMHRWDFKILWSTTQNQNKAVGPNCIINTGHYCRLYCKLQLSPNQWMKISLCLLPILLQYSNSFGLWWTHRFWSKKKKIVLIIAANRLCGNSKISLIQFFEVGRRELQVDGQGLLEVSTVVFLAPWDMDVCVWVFVCVCRCACVCVCVRVFVRFVYVIR